MQPNPEYVKKVIELYVDIRKGLGLLDNWSELSDHERLVFFQAATAMLNIVKNGGQNVY